MRPVRFVLALMLAAALAGPAAAQGQKETLADIRKELATLSTQMQGLRGELVASAARNPGVAGGSALERMDLMERELQRLTSRTEELEHRINQVVKDGTNRIGDLEFRITELEGGDVGAVPPPAPLGTTGAGAAPPTASGAGAATSAPPAARPSGTSTASAPKASLAVGEQGDFDRAREVLGQGDFRTAADLFAAFAETYTAGPLTGEAHFWRGEALTGLGRPIDAAKAYLQSYSGWPDGPAAPQALTGLGAALGKAGQIREACTTLAQVPVRFPDTPAVAEAQKVAASLSCP